MARADITPAEHQELQDQVDVLMARADITPAEHQVLQDQVDVLMARADVTPEELQALERNLVQALTPSWTPTATGVHIDHSTGTAQDTDARVTMLESDGSAGFYVTYMVNGVEQRVHMTRDDFDHGNFEYYKEKDNSRYWLWGRPGNSFTFVPDFSYFDVGGWGAGEFEIAPDGTRSLNEHLARLYRLRHPDRSHASRRHSHLRRTYVCRRFRAKRIDPDTYIRQSWS